MGDERPMRPRKAGVQWRRHDQGEPDACALLAAGFEHEGGCLWSKDGVFYGEEAALQWAWEPGGRLRSESSREWGLDDRCSRISENAH